MHSLFKHAVVPACVALLAAAPSWAQTRSGPSWVPYTTNGYVGLNVGRSDYNLPCTPGFSCDDRETSWHLYTGGMVNDWFGAEVGYIHLGEIDRQGGTTRGHGINLSLVGTVPLTQAFDIFGKVGTTWGRTKVTALAGSGEPVGTESGFGLSYGIGAQFDVTQQWALVAQWDRHRLKFAGRDREEVDAASIGVKYKF